MDIKKITHEEALRRWKHSLEIKREWKREGCRALPGWANEDQQGNCFGMIKITMQRL